MAPSTLVSALVVCAQELLDVVRYLAVLDRCISLVSTDTLLVYVAETHGKVLETREKTASFDAVHDVLCTLYVASERSKTTHQKDHLDVSVVLARWCGYELLTDYDWETIYVADSDVYAAGCVPCMMKTRVCVVSAAEWSCQLGLLQNTKRPMVSGLRKSSYASVAVGGTFDHLHAGHKILLTMAAWICRKKVICGVSDETLLKTKKHVDFIETIETRMTSVRSFFHLINRVLSFSVAPISDIYGATIIDPEIDAIVVSQETISGGNMINEERKRKNMKELDIFCINMISDQGIVDNIESISMKLSSTAIREKMAKKRLK